MLESAASGNDLNSIVCSVTQRGEMRRATKWVSCLFWGLYLLYVCKVLLLSHYGLGLGLFYLVLGQKSTVPVFGVDEYSTKVALNINEQRWLL